MNQLTAIQAKCIDAPLCPNCVEKRGLEARMVFVDFLSRKKGRKIIQDQLFQCRNCPKGSRRTWIAKNGTDQLVQA